jgi:release factor glutamine methyltransferase
MIYDPAEDSFLMQRNLASLVKNKIVLDMGTGSGIQAISSLRFGAKIVTAVDISKEAIDNLKLIKKKNNLSDLKLIQSNLFSKIKGKSDVIIFNPPYLPADSREDKESALITSGGKRGDEITIKFLSQVKPHLNKEGKILLIVSSLTPQNKIKSFLKKKKFDYKVIDSEKVFMENLELWEIKQD